MKKIIWICDCCGKETESIYGWIPTVHSGDPLCAHTVDPTSETGEIGGYDFCQECHEKMAGCIIDVFASVKENQAEERTDTIKKSVEIEVTDLHSEPIEPDNKKENLQKEGNKGKRKIDYGKVMALNRAGWTAKQIADEVGCSEWSVYDILKRVRSGEIKEAL